MVAVLAFCDALAVACSSVMGGVAARRLSLSQVMIIGSPVTALIALVFALPSGAPDPVGLMTGMLAGLTGGVGLAISYRALAIGPVGVAAAIIACTSTAVVTGAGLLAGERLTASRAGAFTLCIAAVLLVSVSRAERGSPRGTPIGPLLALAAGGTFALFVIVLDTTSEDGGWWPLLGARIGVLIIAVTMVLVTIARSGARIVRNDITRTGGLLALGAGVLDVTGNIFLVLALRAGDLVVVAVVAACSPVLTAGIGWLLLREHLRRTQVWGLILAVGAVGLGALP